MPSPATFIFSAKIILIAAGAVSIALAAKLSVPLIMGFCLNDLPILWNTLQTLLKPPYLYFIINGIIITIAASSWFNHHNHNHQVNTSAASQPAAVPAHAPLITIRTPPRRSGVVAAVVLAEAPAEEEEENYEVEEDESEARVVELKPVVVNGINQLEGGDSDGDDDGYVANIPQSAFTPSPEKALVLSSFGNHSKAKTKTRIPEGGRRAGRVEARSRSQQHDTLENTWKMITEGRHVPNTSHFKKSNTWQNHGRDVVSVLDLDCRCPPPPPHVPKPATFRDRTNHHQYRDGATTPPAEIRKDPSLSQDELNRRAEAFIKKFNQEMRLQKQESLNNYMEMINRGAY